VCVCACVRACVRVCVCVCVCVCCRKRRAAAANLHAKTSRVLVDGVVGEGSVERATVGWGIVDVAAVLRMRGYRRWTQANSCTTGSTKATIINCIHHCGG